MNKNNIHGIFLLDKPLHLTSNTALQKVKRLLGAKKAGHTGNLDPLATGMLPICLGEATKFSQFLLESDKAYRVSAKLGITTTTGDAEGETVSTRSVPVITMQSLETILQAFMGWIQQIPPMYSAIKYQGKPLYELARQGITIERKPRSVRIDALQCISIQEDVIELDVRCSKGTYIRTLVEDIGEALGCGAYVISLRRTTVAPYLESQMHTLESLEQLVQTPGYDVYTHVLPLISALDGFPTVMLSAATAFYFRQGQAIRAPSSIHSGFVRLLQGDAFLGIGEMLDDGRIAPRRLLAETR